VYQIAYARSVQKDFDRIPDTILESIKESIKGLATNPMPHGSKKLSGKLGLYRLKEGDYRIVYAFNSEAKQLQITRVKHRKDSYRNI